MAALATTRRTFLGLAAMAAFGRGLPAQATVETSLHLGTAPAAGARRVPVDFPGLSFPAATLSDAAFFSPDNVTLVQAFRLLAPRGLLRIAGGTQHANAVDTKVIDSLDGFLKATGWTCVYGLRTDGDPSAAAAYISNRLGPRLNCFEVSSRSGGTIADILQAAVHLQHQQPGLRFSVADKASELLQWSSEAERPSLTAVSAVYERGAHDLSAETLLRPDPRLSEATDDAGKAAKEVQADGFRFAEAGIEAEHEDLTHTFAAALWSATLQLQAMQDGCRSVCMRDGIFRADGRSQLSPVAMGVKFAAAFAGATMFPVTLDAVSANLAAYAARRPDGKIIAAVFNLEADLPVTITAPMFDTLQVLRAPSLLAKEAHVSTIVNETSSRRTAAGQVFTLPPHMGTLLVLR